MEVAADRLSVRCYFSYDLHEPLPYRSSLTRIRERYGLSVFRRYFEWVVELCAEAWLMWSAELYFDATKVDTDVSLDSIAPRFAVERHLDGLFDDTEPHAAVAEAGNLPTGDEEDCRPRTPTVTTGSPGTDAKGGR